MSSISSIEIYGLFSLANLNPYVLIHDNDESFELNIIVFHCNVHYIFTVFYHAQILEFKILYLLFHFVFFSITIAFQIHHVFLPLGYKLQMREDHSLE